MRGVIPRELWKRCPHSRLVGWPFWLPLAASSPAPAQRPHPLKSPDSYRKKSTCPFASRHLPPRFLTPLPLSGLPCEPAPLRRIPCVLAPPTLSAQGLQVTPIVCPTACFWHNVVHRDAGSSALSAIWLLAQHLRSNPEPVAFVPFETSASCPRLGLVYVAVRISSQRRTARHRTWC